MTDKFRYYRSIPELREYVWVDQDEIAIEQYTKADADSWLFRACEPDADKIRLASVDVEVPLADIYEGVDFSLKDTEGIDR